MIIDRIQDSKVFKVLQEKKTIEKVMDEIDYKSEQLKESFAAFKEQTKNKIYSFNTVEGVFLWEVDYKLNKLANNGIPESDLKKGKITIALPRKKTNDLANEMQRTKIEEAIEQLESFENLRLREFYQYKPVYKEKKIFTQVTRWIEIEIY